MGLFDAKYCSLCGNKLGLLGNTKLADGHLCKACSAKLSPLLTGSKKLTVDDIKEHLEYREKNKLAFNGFSPNYIFGGRKKIYIDDVKKVFVVTSSSDYRAVNADVIPFSAVYNVENEVDEDRDEETYKNAEGKEVSYNPPRYNYKYTFRTTIHVDSRWFSKITLELSEKEEPTEKWNDLYREYDYQQRMIKSLLLQRPIENANVDVVPQPVYTNYSNTPYTNTAYTNQTYNQGVWTCAKCGRTNDGNFCGTCGAPRPTYVCPRCGWTSNDYKALPRFCSNCGWEMNNY